MTQEAQKRSLHLLEKANEQMEEEEDEIKKLNEVRKTKLISTAVFLSVL